MSTLTTDLSQAAKWFAALSDETRLQIVETLVRGERCVCDLQDAVGAAQSRLSFHLKKLKEAGLVEDRRSGRWAYYSLNPETLDAMAEFLASAKPVDHGAGCGCGAGGCC
jgi:ArsR family transcriptional regulator, arsenate/arsenite/antimonite-responsive transcriptional repressor